MSDIHVESHDRKIDRLRRENKAFFAGVGVGVVSTVMFLATRRPRLITISPDQIQEMIENPTLMVAAKKMAIGRFGAVITN